jgi:hypothetical protein
VNEPQKKLRASAKRTKEFFILETHSGFRRSGRDPLGKQHILPVTASASNLGEALRDALTHSRFLSLEEARELFQPERSASSYELWVDGLLRNLAYGSRVELFKNMEACSISQVVGVDQIQLAPMKHTEQEEWSRTTDDNIEDVFVPASVSDEQLGEALLLAFRRCIGH